MLVVGKEGRTQRKEMERWEDESKGEDKIRKVGRRKGKGIERRSRGKEEKVREEWMR